jgi:hypothetical protein
MKEVCKEDGVMSDEFMAAVTAGAEVQVNTETVVGWLTVEAGDLEYRNTLEYRIKAS